MHMPIEHQTLNGPKIPTIYDDPRYTFHNPSKGEWFGRVQNGQLRYERTGSHINMKDPGY